MRLEGVYLVGGLRFHRSIPQFLQAVEEALQGGIRIFQLRVKDALSDREHLDLGKRVRELTRKYNALYFLNDRPDLAVLSEADGLHLGPEDITADEARKIVGDMLIGKSSHHFEQAQAALQESINYLSVGPIYETDCKKIPDPVVGLDLVRSVQPITQVPLVAIGGITLENLPVVLETGVSCFGVIRGVMNSGSIQQAAQSYVQGFEQNRKQAA